MMPRVQILPIPGPEMDRLPKNSNWKLGFSGKKISSNVGCQISNLLGTNHTRFEKVWLAYRLGDILGERENYFDMLGGGYIYVSNLMNYQM